VDGIDNIVHHETEFHRQSSLVDQVGGIGLGDHNVAA
jgi:hypothetical protein